MTKQEEKKKETSKAKLINISLLAKICLEIAEVYRKYSLNRHEAHLISKEMMKFAEMENDAVSKRAFESAVVMTRRIIELEKQKKRDL